MKRNKFGLPTQPITQDEAFVIGRICQTLGYDVESVSNHNSNTIAFVKIKGKSNPSKYKEDLQNGYNRFFDGSLLFIVNKKTSGIFECLISKLRWTQTSNS